MTDLRINTATGDLWLDHPDGPLVSGIDEILQRAWIRLSTQKGEWIFDTSLGVDWYGLFFAYSVSEAIRLDAIRTELLRVPGITRVVSASLDIIGNTAHVAFEVETTFGVASQSLEVSP